MKVEVSTAIEELKRQFSTSTLTVREDGQGGAGVISTLAGLFTKNMLTTKTKREFLTVGG